MASSIPRNLECQDESTPLVLRHKRRNTALSCAECRRCSRVFPCSNCVKKGVSAICPEGSLTTGKGNRFILANTEALHEKIGELSNRVRELEDALAHSHSLHTREIHPLLRDELLSIKRPLEREKDETYVQEEGATEPSETIDALGSLSISPRGRTTFFGQTANSWYLLRNEEGSDGDDDKHIDDILPFDMSWLGYAFPFPCKSPDGIRDFTFSHLPPESTSRQICDVYYRHAAWMYTPVPESDFYRRVFRRVYHTVANPSDDVLESHNLAVLYMILALGTLLDLEKPSNSPEAAYYYQLGRAILSLDSVLETQSILAIQALLLMCHYMFLSGIESPRWMVFGLVVKLTHSVGLHRDSGKWNLSPEDTQQRRLLMWEVYTYDSWQSLTFGRPPSFSLAHIDCQMPYSADNVEMCFSSWKHRFCSQCLSIVHDKAFSARTPNYKTIQELEKRVRKFPFPAALQVPGFGGAKIGSELEQPSIQLTMQRYIAFAIREISIFYMHRGFFARALEEHPGDPLSSKYAPSLLAAYSSACSFIGLIFSLFSQHPALTERMWFLFTHVFSCAIVLGSIAVKSRMALAPSALSHLESAHNLFEQVSENPRAAKVLPILRKLKDRAYAAAHSHREMDPETSNQFPSDHRIKNEADELSVLGGMTRFVSRKSSPATTASPAEYHSVTTPIDFNATPPPKPATYCSGLQDYNLWQENHHVQHPAAFVAYPMIQDSAQLEYPVAYLGPQYRPVDSMPEYYLGLHDVTSLSDLSTRSQSTIASIGSVTPTDSTDPTVSWRNFMAPFLPV